MRSWYFIAIRKIMSTCILILNASPAKQEFEDSYYFVKDRVVEINEHLAQYDDGSYL